MISGRATGRMVICSLLLLPFLIHSRSEPQSLLPIVSSEAVVEGNFGAERKGERPASKTPQPKQKSTPEKNAPASPKYPYHGKLDSFDPSAGTITLKGRAKNRVIAISSDTRITRNNQTATLKEAIIGEDVSGSVTKIDGKEQALTLRLKGKTDPAPARPKAPTPGR